MAQHNKYSTHSTIITLLIREPLNTVHQSVYNFFWNFWYFFPAGNKFHQNKQFLCNVVEFWIFKDQRRKCMTKFEIHKKTQHRFFGALASFLWENLLLLIDESPNTCDNRWNNEITEKKKCWPKTIWWTRSRRFVCHQILVILLSVLMFCKIYLNYRL